MYSVIIPSYYEKDADYLKFCVESLRASGFDGQIIVVTNGSKYNPDLSALKCQHLHTNQQGQCNAVNIGAQVATGEYLMVSNSDMYYGGIGNRKWNTNLRFDYPVFSPNLLEPINNLGSAAPFIKTKSDSWTIEEFEKTKGDIDLQISAYSFHTKNGKSWPGGPKEETGFNLPFFIKREFWQQLGGYDIVYDPWGSNSDTDLQTRINEAGVTPMRLRDVLVYHFSNKSGTFDGTHQEEYRHNLDYFKEKHGFDRDELGSDVWYNTDMLPTDKSRIKYDQKPYIS